jgi:hypothetical protein
VVGKPRNQQLRLTVRVVFTACYTHGMSVLRLALLCRRSIPGLSAAVTTVLKVSRPRIHV